MSTAILISPASPHSPQLARCALRAISSSCRQSPPTSHDSVIHVLPASIPAGTNLIIGILVGSSRGASPTGNVAVTFGAVTQTVALAPILEEGSIFGVAQTTFANLQAGSYTLSASYAGDANWNAVTRQFPTPITVASVNVVPTTTTLTVTPDPITSLGPLKLVATVQAPTSTQGAPFGLVNINLDGVGLTAGVLQATSATANGVMHNAKLIVVIQ